MLGYLMRPQRSSDHFPFNLGFYLNVQNALVNIRSRIGTLGYGYYHGKSLGHED